MCAGDTGRTGGGVGVLCFGSVARPSSDEFGLLTEGLGRVTSVLFDKNFFSVEFASL